ncbi:dirigent protein 16-like [Phragmites australis]|uniref:dirigent protein 16-like n=1 Tax=Phragmites australis TaxID=29695 RepID=UPI002D773B35|nr:dirigent protein 16-like [Phragmites australis]
MQARSCTRIVSQACIALAVLLGTMAAGARPASHSAPSAPHSSDQTITLYTTGAAPPRATAAFSQHPVFTSQGPIAHSNSWLRALTRPGALRPGTVTVVDEQLRGKKEFGLPLEGRLQGILVTSLADNSSHMVAVKASFAGDGTGDSLRFFGVRRDDEEESHIALVGGTGRYDGATGFAVLRAADAPETGGNVSLSRALSFRVHLK